jgi:hypothetical protein
VLLNKKDLPAFAGQLGACGQSAQSSADNYYIVFYADCIFIQE